MVEPAALVPLILLPGALGQFEGTDTAVQRLSGSRPVFPISYREDDSLEALFERIESAAGQAGPGPVDLLGQSYGGWIAQCFARHRPERVRRLVLSHSFALSPSDAWRFRLARTLFRRLPGPVLRILLMKRIRLALRPVAAAQPELHRRQLVALARLVRSRPFFASLAAQQECLWQSVQPATASLPPVAAPVMIIESEDDPLVGKAARATLRDRHPRAPLLRFETAGHLSAILETERYVAAVEDFLER